MHLLKINHVRDLNTYKDYLKDICKKVKPHKCDDWSS